MAAKRRNQPKRDATKEETRAALLAAGAALFAEDGLDVPSLDAICDRAGFTRGAFYVHFKDREDFIIAVMVEATGRFLEGLLAVEGEVLDIRHIVLGFASAIGSEGFPVFGPVPMHQVLAACARHETTRKRYAEIIQETRGRIVGAIRAAQRDGIVRDGVDATNAAGLLLAVALGVGALREVGVDFDAPAHAATMLELLG